MDNLSVSDANHADLGSSETPNDTGQLAGDELNNDGTVGAVNQIAAEVCLTGRSFFPLWPSFQVS